MSPAQAADTVTVTATRTPVRVSDAVAEVTVLDRRDLDRASGRTLVELLSQQAGIQFSSSGGLGKTASLFMRGLEARHTLLLVDGVRVGSATVGSPSLDNLPLEVVERIEIVRGPLSSLYGNGAMGGVIQVFTRRAPQGLGGEAKLTLGSDNLRQVAIGGGFGSGAFDIAAQLQLTRTDGFSSTNSQVPFGSFNADNDGFRQTGGSLRLGWQLAPGWRLEGMTLQSQGLSRIDDGPGADARAELRNRLALVALQGQVLPGWQTRVALAQSSDEYDTLASASAFATLGVIGTRQRQLQWENTLQTPVGTVLALVERLTEKVTRPEQAFTVSERDIDGLALGLTGAAGPHSWQASLRRDHNSQFGGITTGAAGYAIAFTPAWRLGASYGSSHSVPSFNQLYFPGFGNDKLLPEEGKHGELSLRWAEGQHSLRAALYRHRYRGFISSGPQPQNLPTAQIDGVTLAYEGRIASLDAKASYDHTDPRNTTLGNSNFDKLLPRRTQQALRGSLDGQFGAWSVGATSVAFSHRFDNAANTSRLGGYATLDLRADWAVTRELNLGLKLNNIADKPYQTALGYNQPGREVQLAARFALR